MKRNLEEKVEGADPGATTPLAPAEISCKNCKNLNYNLFSPFWPLTIRIDNQKLLLSKLFRVAGRGLEVSPVIIASSWGGGEGDPSFMSCFFYLGLKLLHHGTTIQPEVQLGPKKPHIWHANFPQIILSQSNLNLNLNLTQPQLELAVTR